MKSIRFFRILMLFIVSCLTIQSETQPQQDTTVPSATELTLQSENEYFIPLVLPALPDEHLVWSTSDLPEFIQIEHRDGQDARLILSPINEDKGTYELTLNALPLTPLSIQETEERRILVFNEEFQYEPHSRNIWENCYAWNEDICRNEGNNELQAYLPQALSFTDGHLNITADYQPESDTPYQSGMISSHQSFSFQYGYVEARVKAPVGQGLWSALWMLPITYDWPPEIDIFEILGHEPELIHTSLHYRDDNGLQRETFAPAQNYTDDYVTFGMDWQPERIIWYIDGIEVFQSTVGIPHEPMYLIANLAIGGDWAGTPQNPEIFPATYTLDYIRVWQKPHDLIPNTIYSSVIKPYLYITDSILNEIPSQHKITFSITIN